MGTKYKENEDQLVLVAGTFDTKGDELTYLADRLKARNVTVHTVDLSTSAKASSSTADVKPADVASWHPRGASAVVSDDRGQAVAAMSVAFEHWMEAHKNVAGIISAGGSGGTALVTPAMRRLPIGTPKVMISTVASGNVAPYVGPSDMMMMYSVTDVEGIHQISEQVFGNGADALAGMLAPKIASTLQGSLPTIGLTMFGVTTAAVQTITSLLDSQYECLVFHATGIGGQSMEKLADSGMLSGVIDLTTTEVCDLLMGGVFSATEDRFGSVIRTKIPFVGSVGALDMVNFGAPDTVPSKFADRKFFEHNPQVTLMRTTVEENKQLGNWIGNKLNEMEGPVRFLLPEAGLSAIDADGQPFNDPEARKALYDALANTVKETDNRKLIHSPLHINDAEFAKLAVQSFQEIID